jgi:hypothetical protein
MHHIDKTGAKMPPEQECLRAGVLQRKSIGTRGFEWADRLVVLTEDALLFGKPDDSERTISDYILLHDVVECELKEDEDAMSSIPSASEVNLDHRASSNSLMESCKRTNPAKLEIFRTKEDCHNCGRSYIYRSSFQDAVDWEKDVDLAVMKAKSKAHDIMMQETYGHSFMAMTRAKTKIMIDSIIWQYLLAAVIIFGFLIHVIEVSFCPFPPTNFISNLFKIVAPF